MEEKPKKIPLDPLVENLLILAKEIESETKRITNNPMENSVQTGCE